MESYATANGVDMKYIQRQWVGLTEKEVNQIRKKIFAEFKKAIKGKTEHNEQNDYSAWNFYKQIEKKLKERNE